MCHVMIFTVKDLEGRGRVLSEDTISAFTWSEKKIVKNFSQDSMSLGHGLNTRPLTAQTTRDSRSVATLSYRRPRISLNIIRFEVLTTMKIPVVALCVMIQCSQARGYQSCGGIYSLQLHSRNKDQNICDDNQIEL